MSTMVDTTSLCHDIKLAADLRAGDHVWQRGEVDRIFPVSRSTMFVQFTDGSKLQYNPREKVLCDRDER